MIISLTTQNGVFYEAHTNQAEAAKYLIGSLRGDHADDFYLDDDGRLVENPHSRVDFGLTIYGDVAEALDGLKNMDSDFLPHALRALAAAVENGYKNGLD